SQYRNANNARQRNRQMRPIRRNRLSRQRSQNSSQQHPRQRQQRQPQQVPEIGAAKTNQPRTQRSFLIRNRNRPHCQPVFARQQRHQRRAKGQRKVHPKPVRIQPVHTRPHHPRRRRHLRRHLQQRVKRDRPRNLNSRSSVQFLQQRRISLLTPERQNHSNRNQRSQQNFKRS